MRSSRRFVVFVFVFVAVLALVGVAAAAPFGTAFTYQGALRDAGSPANGSYDLQFTPYGVLSGGSVLAPPVVVENVAVAEGIFTARVDFGSSFFVGDEVFLEIAVRPGTSTGGFQPLLPRQSISAVPYAQKVRAGSVSPIELAPGAVTGPSLEVNAVGASAIAPSAVGTSELADGSVAAADLGTNAVGADEIAAGAVDTGELADGAVTTAKLEDASVTRPKIAPGAVGANEIDPSQIQVRPAGSCPSGLPLLGFDASGAIYCSDAARVVDVGVASDQGIDLAVRDDDRPVIAYSYGFGLAVQACDDPLCTSGTRQTITTAFDAGSTASLALRTNNLALVSYVDSTADQLRLHVCGNFACSSPQTRSLASVGAITLPTSLSLDAGSPVIAYGGDTGTATEVRLFVCNASATCNAGGTIRTLDASAPNLDGLALVVRASPAFRPLVAYAEADGVGNRVLQLHDCADASCATGSTRTLDGAGTDSAGAGVSMAIRPDGRPILAYQAGLSDNDLRIYDCADANCASGTIRLGETTGDSGQGSSIEIRADGRPLVSHYQTSGGGVRLWDCADANCTSGTARGIDFLDSAGSQGIALALRGDGRPVVGYLSLTGARTRVHVCGRTDCATPP